MLGNLTGWHLVLVLAIVLLLFGAPKLPALARSIAQSMRIFKSEVKSDEPESAEAPVVVEPVVAAPVAVSAAVPTPAAVKTEKSKTDATPAKKKKSSSGKSAAKS
ncbi:MAG: twin-arginine translocase TatA/TatE family subunit [Microbacteriaceae bacterium]